MEKEKKQKQEQEKVMENELALNGGSLVWAKVMRAIVETSRNLCLPVGKRVRSGI